MMVDVIIRDELVALLKPKIPKRYAFVEVQRTVDNIVKPTVVLRQERIERDPTAPARIRRAFFTIVLASPLDDTGAAERTLDDDVVEIINKLDEVEGLVWTTCTKGVWSEENPAPCYAVELWIPYSKTKG